MVSDTIAVGVLTFVGTGLATAAGLWQWRRTQAREARAGFRARRVEALGEVWEALSDFEESQRTSLTHGPRRDPAPNGQAQLNLLLLRRLPFLRPDEQEWAQAFARHLVEIDTLIRAAGRDERPDATWWASTQSLPASAQVAASAAHQLGLLRAKLSERYAAVVRGDSE